MKWCFYLFGKVDFWFGRVNLLVLGLIFINVVYDFCIFFLWILSFVIQRASKAAMQHGR